LENKSSSATVTPAADFFLNWQHRSLGKLYWYPLCAYVRRQDYCFNDAEELTQGFFVELLAKDYLEDVDRRKGKFRSFLLAAIKHYLRNENT
jgi:DNA-directed RNA polymerase specialized sigma24 family protein